MDFMPPSCLWWPPFNSSLLFCFTSATVLRGLAASGITEKIQAKEKPLSILEVRKRLLLNYCISYIVYGHLCQNNLEGGRMATLIRLGVGRQ